MLNLERDSGSGSYRSVYRALDFLLMYASVLAADPIESSCPHEIHRDGFYDRLRRPRLGLSLYDPYSSACGEIKALTLYRVEEFRKDSFAPIRHD